ncbi:PPOX class F420-dependent oxidoreductase [Angustibacter peucedani]
MSDLMTMGGERFVSLTTFRSSGEPVSTPVWIGRDGDGLVVLTPAGSGKVKRVRHDARVELRPCNRFGRVPDDAPAASATASVHEEPPAVDRARAAIARAYPVESRLVLGLERLVQRLRGRAPARRVALRIS